MSHLSSQRNPVLALDSAGRSHTLAGDLREMAKLRITSMVALTAYIGFALGVQDAGIAMDFVALAAALIGTSLSCMGASVLNQCYEIDTDALMERTHNRPLPAGRLSLVTGIIFGITLSFTGIAMLAALTTLLAAGLSALTILSYALLYTPLKRVTSTSTIVGAAPGALPPVIGYAAATGYVGISVMCIFAIMFLWQLPHFLAIAWLYREDYARAKFPFLPILEPDGRSTFRQILIGCFALLPLSLLPTLLDVTGMVYFTGALIAGIGQLIFGVRLVVKPTRQRARQMFFSTLVYLPIVLILFLID